MDLMLLGFETPFTIGLAVIGLIVVIGSHMYLQNTFRKYKRMECEKKLSGFEVARKILDEHGLTNVHIVEVEGELTDHYDPSRKVVRLSKNIFHGTTIAAISVAAHEVGHAIQDKDKYIFMNIRSILFPLVKFVSILGFFSIFISIFAGITTYLYLGIIVILATLVFQLATLPVEFDASRRAREELYSLNLIYEEEIPKVKSMLTAAALTYVAGVISSLISLIRLIIMAQSNNRD